jgi:hypothetical protein
VVLTNPAIVVVARPRRVVVVVLAPFRVVGVGGRVVATTSGVVGRRVVGGGNPSAVGGEVEAGVGSVVGSGTVVVCASAVDVHTMPADAARAAITMSRLRNTSPYLADSNSA